MIALLSYKALRVSLFYTFEARLFDSVLHAV